MNGEYMQLEVYMTYLDKHRGQVKLAQGLLSRPRRSPGNSGIFRVAKKSLSGTAGAGGGGWKPFPPAIGDVVIPPSLAHAGDAVGVLDDVAQGAIRRNHAVLRDLHALGKDASDLRVGNVGL